MESEFGSWIKLYTPTIVAIGGVLAFSLGIIHTFYKILVLHLDRKKRKREIATETENPEPTIIVPTPGEIDQYGKQLPFTEDTPKHSDTYVAKRNFPFIPFFVSVVACIIWFLSSDWIWYVLSLIAAIYTCLRLLSMRLNLNR